MAYDCVIAVYSGVHNNGALLQFLEVDEFSFESNQIGGLGKGTFQGRYAYEQSSTLGYAYTTNINSPNRVAAYLRLDQVTIAPTVGSNSLNVSNPSRFKVGQSIAIYDGVNYDVAAISVISGSVLSLSQGLTHAYAVGITVFALRYSGYISSVMRNASTENVTTFETSGYQTQMNQRRATANGGGKECGWFLFNLLQTFAGQWDLICNASNFTMSTNGAIPGGTGIAYNGSQTDSPIASIVNDVILYANSNVAKTQYTLWIDETNTVHFGPLNIGTPTVTVDLMNPSSVTADGLFDLLSAHDVRDQDLQGLCNVATIVGGNDGFGNPIKAIVQDSLSISTYGQWECQVSNTGIKTEADAQKWGQSYLAVNAYPRQQTTSTLSVVGSFATAQDYLRVTGFVDGSHQDLSVQTITTHWKAGDQQFGQQIKGLQQFPNITRLMSQIAAQHYLASGALADMGSNIHDRFVIDGLNGSYASSTFTMALGDIGAITSSGLTTFAVPGFTFVPTIDGNYTVAFLYRNADNSTYNGTGGPQVVSFKGTSVPVGSAYTNAQIIPLYYVYRLGGIITAYDDKRQFGGLNLALLKSIQYPAPTISLTSNSPAIGVPGLTTEVIVNTTVTNVPQDYGCSRIAWFKRITGTTQWIPEAETALAPFPLPSQTQAVSLGYGQLHNGQTLDFGLAYVNFGGSVNYTSGITTLLTGVSANAVAIPVAYQLGGVAITPTFSGTPSVTPQTSINGISAAVTLNVTLNNQPTGSSLSRIGFWYRVQGTTPWNFEASIPAYGVGQLNPPAIGPYSFTYGAFTGSTTYELGASYENAQGGESSVGIMYSNYVATVIAVSSTSLAKMPSGLLSAGPNVSVTSASFTNQNTSADYVNFVFNINDAISSSWYNGIQVYSRLTGSGNAVAEGIINPQGIIANASGTVGGISAGLKVDIGLAYRDISGQVSAVSYPALLSNLVAPLLAPGKGIAGSGNGNFIPDPQLAHRLSSGIEAYWYSYLIDGISFACSDGMTGDNRQGFNLFRWTSGSNGTTRYANSQPFNLAVGTYTASCYIDLINATGSGGMRIIGPVSGTVTNTNPGAAPTAIASVIQSANQSSGNTSLSSTFTVTTAGAYVAQASNAGITIGGSPIFMGAFQVESGSIFTGFKTATPVQTQGSDVGTVAHAAHSTGVQNTVSPNGGIDFNYANHANKNLDNIPDGSTYGRPYRSRINGGRPFIDFSEGIHSNQNTDYILGGSATRQQFADSHEPNLVQNSAFSAPARPNNGEYCAGWSNYGGTAGIFSALRETGTSGNDFLIRLNQNVTVPASSSVYQAVLSQAFNLIPNRAYVIRANQFGAVNATFPGGLGMVQQTVVRVYYADGSTQDFGANVNNAPNNGPVEYYAAFTVPNKSVNYAIVYMAVTVTNSTGSAFSTGGGLYADMRWGAVTVWGAKVAGQEVYGVLNYSNMNYAFTNNFDSNGNTPNSAFLANQGSVAPFTTNGIFHIKANANSIAVWIDNGTDNNGFYVYYANTNSKLFIYPYNNSTTPFVIGNLNASSAIYVLAAFNKANATWQIGSSYYPLDAPSLQILINDGYIPMFYNVGTTSPISTASATQGATYSPPSTTGGCPAVGERIETLERGVVLVESLLKGEHLRDPDMGWNKIEEDIKICEADIFAVKFNHGTVCVEPSHLFYIDDMNKKNVQELEVGDTFPRYGGGTLIVESVKNTGPGHYVHIQCERFRYVLADVGCSNLKQARVVF